MAVHRKELALQIAKKERFRRQLVRSKIKNLESLYLEQIRPLFSKVFFPKTSPKPPPRVLPLTRTTFQAFKPSLFPHAKSYKHLNLLTESNKRNSSSHSREPVSSQAKKSPKTQKNTVNQTKYIMEPEPLTGMPLPAQLLKFRNKLSGHLVGSRSRNVNMRINERMPSNLENLLDYESIVHPCSKTAQVSLSLRT